MILFITIITSQTSNREKSLQLFSYLIFLMIFLIVLDAFETIWIEFIVLDWVFEF